MAHSSDVLRSLELRAERAIAQELRQMVQEILALRPQLEAGERSYADALLLKLDWLANDQQTACPADPAEVDGYLEPALQLDASHLLPDNAPAAYKAIFDSRVLRHQAQLREEITLETFEAAVQTVVDRLQHLSNYLVEAQWLQGRGTLQVRDLSGQAMARVEPVVHAPVVVHPCVARACQALRRGNGADLNDLFGQALMAA